MTWLSLIYSFNFDSNLTSALNKWPRPRRQEFGLDNITGSAKENEVNATLWLRKDFTLFYPIFIKRSLITFKSDPGGQYIVDKTNSP